VRELGVDGLCGGDHLGDGLLALEQRQRCWRMRAWGDMLCGRRRLIE
jgi:hypothetical protein